MGTAGSKEDENTLKTAAKVGVAVAVGLSSFAAAPFVATAAVGALGFGGGGVVAGSTAAWLMSFGGGVTPAVVAVAQSIGATGALCGATQAAVGAAAGACAYKKL